MKKYQKIILASALSAGLCLGGVALAGCGEKTPTLEVTTEFKAEYYIGETVDVTGGILTYTDKAGNEKYIAIEDDMITGFTTTTEGERSMIITYEDLTILYPYTVVDYPFVQIGVPYYVLVETMDDSIMYSSFIFDDDGSISLWSSPVLPTLKNASEIFKLGSEVATFVEKVDEYTKEVVNQKYELSFMANMGGMTPTETTVTIEDENTVVVETVIQVGQAPFTITLKAAGNVDEKLEYGAYYVGSSEGSYAVMVIDADGKLTLVPLSQQPTLDTIEELIEQSMGTGMVQEVNYATSLKNNELVFDAGDIELTLNQQGQLIWDNGSSQFVFTKLA